MHKPVVNLSLGRAIVVAMALTLCPTAGYADPAIYYLGPHAVPGGHGGFCTIHGRHLHRYRPVDPKVFRLDGDTYVFIGDPTGHGYTGPRILYYGHHPIPGAWGGNWCFIDGPHYHIYRPAGVRFSFQGGVYYYVGAFTDPWYVKNRTIYEPVFRTYYVGRRGYVRPTIVGAPPRAYVGPRMGGGPHQRVEVKEDRRKGKLEIKEEGPGGKYRYKEDRRSGKLEIKEERRGGKYEYKEDRHGVKVKVEDRHGGKVEYKEDRHGVKVKVKDKDKDKDKHKGKGKH